MNCRRLAGWLLSGFAVFLLTGFSGDRSSPKPTSSMPAASVSKPALAIDFSQAAPREVEEKTEATVARDYSRAWHDLSNALAQNRADLLAGSFTGFAQERLASRIAAQRKAGLSTHYIEHGHRVQAIFYSPEGSAIQLRDAVQLEMQVLDGSSIISSQNATVNFVILMTATQDGWRVRLLQEAPGS
jgi:hypothetical protein